MKRLIALVLAGLMMISGFAMAAEWPAGTSPSKPYVTLNEDVNLDENIGFIILYPNEKLPAPRFCDTLFIWLPREDVELGTGTIRLCETVEGEKDPVEVCTIDVEADDVVSIEKLSESELESLHWGGGCAVKILLPKSLEFADGQHHYHVLMDEGFITASNGKVKNPPIANAEAWKPAMNAEKSLYGVSGLFYEDAEPVSEEDETAAESIEEDDYIDFDDDEEEIVEAEGEAEEGEEAEEEEPEPEPEPTEAPTATPEPEPEPTVSPKDLTPVMHPDVGDIVHFDLVLGEEAVSAIPYSPNGSVEFAIPEAKESGHITGTVVRDDIQWCVVFLNDQGEEIQGRTLFFVGH